jgi:hypothetical protein
MSSGEYLEWKKSLYDIIYKTLPDSKVLSAYSSEFTLNDNRYLIPIFICVDTEVASTSVRSAFTEAGIVGVDIDRKGHIRFNGTKVASLIQLRNDTYDMSGERLVSPKYFLPSLYRMMEQGIEGSNTSADGDTEDGEVGAVFELEAKLIEHLVKKSSSFHKGRPLRISVESVLKDLASSSKEYYLTGTSAACLSLGEEVQFPIEIALKDDKEFSNLGLTKRKYEEQKFYVAHPSGALSCGVARYLLDGELVIIAYNSIGTYSKVAYREQRGQKITSPFFTMAQLCLSAWLMERRNIDRCRQIYGLLVKYRELPLGSEWKLI